jgi:hypothetical protein
MPTPAVGVRRHCENRALVGLEPDLVRDPALGGPIRVGVNVEVSQTSLLWP